MVQFDGDADRLIAVDELGRQIDGDKMIYICAKMLKGRKQLPGDMVTATVMSNIGFHRAVENIGCKVETTQVGDRYVLESMLKTGCVIGGEQSGHIIFLNHTTTGDGIMSALQLIRSIKSAGVKPSVLADEVTIYPQVLKNAKIKNENKKKYVSDPEISSEISRLEEIMAGEGRVLIRPSGTEPLVRVMIEGKDIEQITKLAEHLASLITKRLG
jgi:phosphoglucosamine mutase